MNGHRESGSAIQVHRNGGKVWITFDETINREARFEARNILAENGRITDVRTTGSGRNVWFTATIVRKGIPSNKVGDLYRAVKNAVQADLDTFAEVLLTRDVSMRQHPAKGRVRR